MATYNRNPSLVTEFNRLRWRLDAVERKTLGTLSYSSTTNTTVTTGTSLWSDTIYVPDEGILEFAANLLITTTGAAEAYFTFYIDGTAGTQFAYRNAAGAGSLRLSTVPGDPNGAQGSGNPGAFIIPTSVAPNGTGSGWNIDPGEHDVEVKCNSKSGAGTVTVADFTIGVRAS